MSPMHRFVPKFNALESRVTPSAGGNLGYYLDYLPKTAIRNAISQVLPPNQTIDDITFDDQAKDGPVAVGTYLRGVGDAVLVVGLVDNKGNPIRSFSGDGVVTFTLVNPFSGTAFEGMISSIETDTDGTILIAGYVKFGNYPEAQSYTFLAKLTADGQLDPSFGDGGQVIIPTDFTFGPLDIAFLPDHSFVVLGSTSPTNPWPNAFYMPGQAILKYSADGRHDTSFGQGGTFVLERISDRIDHAIAVQPGTGRILVALNSIKNDMTVLSVLGVTPEGRLDLTFGDRGIAWNEAIPTAQATVGFFMYEDGTFTLTGKLGDGTGWLLPWETKTKGLLVARFNADGTPDDTFGTDGYLAPELGRFIRLTESDLFQNYIRKTWVNPIDRLEVLGVSEGTNRSVIFYTAAYRYVLGTPEYFAVRIDANGNVDTTYGTSGKDLALSTGGLNEIDFNREIDGPDETPMLDFVPTSDVLLVGGPADGTRSFDTSGKLTTLLGTTRFFPNSKASVRTVAADVNGDGVADLIGAEGAGGESRVFIVDGASRERLAELRPYETGYTGGVFVSAGDIDGDGRADLVVTPDRGGGPVVVIYDGEKLSAGLNNQAQISRFMGIEDAQFRGGARSSLGDVNGDGRADLLVSAGHLGGPRIALFDGSGIPENGTPPKLVNDFFAFESTVRNGTYVALGDINGDGLADLFFGGGPGSGPRIRAFDAKTLLASPAFRALDELPNAQLANFFAGDDANRGGVRLTVKSIDSLPALVVGSGENEPGRVQLYNAATLLSPAPIVPDTTFDAFDGAVLADGVFVG